MAHSTEWFKYGVVGAGGVGASLIGRLPFRARELGPVLAVSYRVASRIANTLRAGFPVRKAEQLNAVPSVLFHSPPDQLERLLGVLETAEIDWMGKALVFCDCFVDHAVLQRFGKKGASTAVVRQFSVPGYMVVEGNGGKRDAAVQAVHRIVRELRMRAVSISPGSADLFYAAVTLGSAATTPLIDRSAALFHDAGIRSMEAARLSISLFEQTARDYARSGKQSWAWYARKPEMERLRAQLAAAGPDLEPVLRQLLLFGLETFRKHGEVAGELAPDFVRTGRLRESGQ